MKRRLPLICIGLIISTSFPTIAQLATKEYSVSSPQQINSFITTSSKAIKSLSIGDRVPNIEFKMTNYSKPKAHLSDFRGKLIIIDFWASWCYSCLAGIPKLNKIQSKFSDQLQVILVNSIETTGDNKEKVGKIFQKYSVESPLKFLISYEDSAASDLFPHYSLPHYAWITSNGLVKAITSSEEVTEENVSMLLQNENIELPWSIKKDYFPDKLLDLSLKVQQLDIDDDLEYYSIFKKGRLDGLKMINTLRKVKTKDGNNTEIRGISMRNVPLIELFETAVPFRKDKSRLKEYTRKRLILEIKDSSKFFFSSSKLSKDDWEKENLYTYDIVIPASELKKMHEYIWDGVNKYSGFVAKIENRSVRCLLLEENDRAKPADPKDRTNSSSSILKGIHYLKNSSCSMLTKMLELNQGIRYPVINKTTRNIKIDVEFDSEQANINKLREQLAPLGLELKESICQIDVLVISEKEE